MDVDVFGDGADGHFALRDELPHDAADVPEVGLPAVVAGDLGADGDFVGDVVPLGAELLGGVVAALAGRSHAV